MMITGALFVLFSGAAASRIVPNVKKVDMDEIPTTMVGLKEEEYKLIDELFTIAQTSVTSYLGQVSQRTTKVTKISAGAPAGAPGGPGAPAPYPFGLPKPQYRGIKPAMKATVGPIFRYGCAEVLEKMAIKRNNALAKIGFSNESIGIDLATHFQVQCPGSIPMPEDKCDDYATQLAKLVDSGKPIFIPPPPGPAGAPGAPGGAPGAAPAAASFMQRSMELVHPLAGGAPSAALLAARGAPGAPGAPGGPGSGEINSGNDWCDGFFNEFFDAIVAQVAAAGPAGAPGGAPAPAR